MRTATGAGTDAPTRLSVLETPTTSLVQGAIDIANDLAYWVSKHSHSV